MLAIEDAETGELIELNTGNQTMRERFCQLAHNESELLRRAFNSEAVDSLNLSTAEPYLPALLGFFKSCERRHA